MSDFVFGHLADLAARVLQRARNVPVDADEKPPLEGASYADWLARYELPAEAERAALAAWLVSTAELPLVSLLCASSAPDDAALAQTIASLERQLYPHWELVIAGPRTELASAGGSHARLRHLAVATDLDPSSVLNTALESARGALCAVIDAGDALAPHALVCAVRTFKDHADTALVYSDEDERDAQGHRHSPRFKPDVNLELLRATHYIGRLALFSTAWVRRLEGFDPAAGAARELDLVLRLLDAAGESAVRHVPRVLYQSGRPHTTADPRWTQAAVQRHLDRRQIVGDLRPSLEVPGALVIRYPLPEPPPRISVIIPTRNHSTLLRQCLDSLTTVTDYPSLDILVIDNGSDDERTLADLRALDGHSAVRVMRDARPFNWAALNNAAVARSSGDLLCFLNDDVEALTPAWLREMASLASRPDVGVVGARLWYPDDTIQHAGVVLHPATGASHVFKRLPRGQAGHLGRAVLTQQVSAVTGACMVVRRDVFTEAGGFDEAFAVDFNDIDFCLRVQSHGYRNLWTPHAELRHHEAATRGPWEAPGNRQRFERAKTAFLERWGALAAGDPAFNPNMRLTNTEPPLAWPPRRQLVV